MLALSAAGTVRSALQYASLVLGVVFGIAFGFALLDVAVAAPLLHRTTVAAVAVAAAIPLYGFGIVKILRRENEWTRAAQNLLPTLTIAAALLFAAVLGIESYEYFTVGFVDVAPAAIAATAVALLVTFAGALAAALLPGRDPLGLSERGRTAYVYGAEAVLGLVFLHIRITVPELFGGMFAQYWPLIVMGLAFWGVGLSEFFRRKRLAVLSEPFQNTGAILPLLPALGLFFWDSAVDHSLTLLIVGGLYFTLGMLRNSIAFVGLALIAVNAGLWVFLRRTTGLGLFEHPQLWLIPPSLCVLIAAHLNRGRLSVEQQTTIRYLAAITLYASSTADIFIQGVAAQPWLPPVLAALSIAGVFVGIWLRIRAFLYLGVAFLATSLFTMIWHAAVELDHTWIWWVCGIVSGC
ncbi:MAG: hypothetical protein QM811_07975 [Pirellulales bacterium]